MGCKNDIMENLDRQKPRRFSIGYQSPDLDSFQSIIFEYSDNIEEIYFPWSGIPHGRGFNMDVEQYQKQMELDLLEASRIGIKMNMLCNATCYGGEALSVKFRENIMRAVTYCMEKLSLHTVTTTSLFVAEILKEKFPRLDIRASVNMDIGSVAAMNYVKDYFDGFYFKRELNRYPGKIRLLKKWCEINHKKLFMLANSGCLKECSARMFHDNLVAHEQELIKHSGQWRNFNGVCWEYYSQPENHQFFLTNSTWIRPEEVSIYEDIIDGVKLATRSNRDPKKVVAAYSKQKYSGNILSLCEPDFSVFCFINNNCLPDLWFLKAGKLSEKQYQKYCLSLLETCKENITKNAGDPPALPEVID